LATAAQFMFDQATYLAAHAPVADATDANKSPLAPHDPQRAALVSFCHTLLSSNRFLYMD
jgi:hypothetical protein